MDDKKSAFVVAEPTSALFLLQFAWSLSGGILNHKILSYHQQVQKA